MAAADTALVGLLGDLQRLEAVIEGWDESQRSVAEAYRHAIEALHGQALRTLVRALKSEPAALVAMKQAATDEVVYAVLRRHEILKPSLSERVEAALASVRPMLASHGGDVELVSIEPPAIAVRFRGNCDGCPASMLTFHEGVKKAIEAACPEISEVRQLKGSASERSEAADIVSPFALVRGGWTNACELSQIPDGGVRAVELRGEHLLLARRGERVTCFDNACAHLGLTLDDGEVRDGVLTCPHHGFQYDLDSGECLTATTVQLSPRPVRVTGARVEVRLER
jgi:nitrite reductase/ring-hydroxylating ferredoxin subunit/Fe-S cluster biogenesis protein NfuA